MRAIQNTCSSRPWLLVVIIACFQCVNLPAFTGGAEQVLTISGVNSAAMLIDSANRFHLFYARYSINFLDPNRNIEVYYITNQSGQITTAVLDSFTVPVEPYTSDSPGIISPKVALGPSGSLHLAYGGGGFNGLRYLTNASGDWQQTAVDLGPSVVKSWAVDGSGKVHMAFGGESLQYATNTTGNFTLETVDDTCAYFSYDELVLGLNSANLPVIIYVCLYDYYSNDPPLLKMAEYQAGGWRQETILEGQI